MIRSTILLTVLLVSSSLLITCEEDDFLSRTPTAVLSLEVLSNEAGINDLLIGAYAVLDGAIFGARFGSSAASNWIWGEVTSDNAHTGSTITDEPAIIRIERYLVTPVNIYPLGKWIAPYEGVARCNNVLRAIKLARENNTVEEEKLLIFEAEARLLRGHYHFEAKKVFDRVPFIHEDLVDVRVPNNTDIWPEIEIDFQFAVEHLPEFQPEPGRVNLWTAITYLAKAYMHQNDFSSARSLLDQIINDGPYALMSNFNHNFDMDYANGPEQIFAVQNSVGDGAPGDDNGNWGDILNYPFGSGAPIGCCGFYQPSQNLVNAFQTDDLGLPLVENFNQEPGVTSDMGIPSTRTWQQEVEDQQSLGFIKDSTYLSRADPATPHMERVYVAISDVPLTDDPLNSPQSYRLVWEEPLNNLDPRLDWTVGRRGIPYRGFGIHPGRDWIRQPEVFGHYSPKKNVWKVGDEDFVSTSWTQGLHALNTVLIRYADVLLWRAEVAVEDGDLSLAMEYVNQIRRRAMNSPKLEGDNLTPSANYVISEYPQSHPAFSDQKVARKVVRFERRLELAMEGHRFFDLVRWGIAAEVINEYLKVERTRLPLLMGPANFIAGKNERMPIPQTEIDVTTVGGVEMLTQNPGY